MAPGSGPQPHSEPVPPVFVPADDRVRLGHWLPPRYGTAPHLRVGRGWFPLLWLIPIAVVLLLAAVAVAVATRDVPAIHAFLARYPGAPADVTAVRDGFPGWLRWQHLLNLFFLVFIIRAGIQILADHPRLYWNRNSTPGTEWFRFQTAVPRDRYWTAKDDSVTLPGWLGIPGLRHSVGLARWWHFSCDLLWVLNGAVFYVLLFATGQWRRLVPMSWAVFPNAVSTAYQYLSLRFPVNHGWLYYNSLQQLAYFITVFVAAPLAVATGLLQGPAIANRLGAIGRRLHRQTARSLHFLVLCWFLFFIAVHVTMVFATGWKQNLNHMFAGFNNASWRGPAWFAVAMVVLAVLWVSATPFTLRHARFVQRAGHLLLARLAGGAERGDVRAQYTRADISPFFWPNGRLPESAEYEALVAGQFAAYRLRVGGLVAAPAEFSLADLRAMPQQRQITEHFCIQGWSGVAEWGGVPMRDVLALTRPLPDARYAVFYSFAPGSEGGEYYDVHQLANMRHHLTLLALDMNGQPLSIIHGAPLRLRCENELGFKQVKWISAVEFVSEFRALGAGQGGYNEDHEFYGYRAPL
ncbi:MAG: molybdopterin-dependent oxidoreductase [Terriglobales bacterium]